MSEQVHFYLVDCGLYVVGSSMNGFGSRTSDMDMCLMLSQSEVNKNTGLKCILRGVTTHHRKMETNFLVAQSQERSDLCAHCGVLLYFSWLWTVTKNSNFQNFFYISKIPKPKCVSGHSEQLGFFDPFPLTFHLTHLLNVSFHYLSLTPEILINLSLHLPT